MSETYQPGELFVYVNGDRWELGQVKRPNNTGDGYFCWYSTGDTAANTPVGCMHKLANAGWSHVEATTLDMMVEDVSADESGIMQIPKTVSILGVAYGVRMDDLEAEDGYISPKRQEIVLRAGMMPDKEGQVFLHEVVHGILDQLGYGELYEDERLVQGLAIGLHEALPLN